MFHSLQAITLTIFISILLICLVIMSVKEDIFKPTDTILYVLSALYAFILIYDTDCLSVGECGVWSWIRTSMYIILITIVCGIILFAIYSKQRLVLHKPNQNENKISTSPTSSTM
jgi:predicted ferric reductase